VTEDAQAIHFVDGRLRCSRNPIHHAVDIVSDRETGAPRRIDCRLEWNEIPDVAPIVCPRPDELDARGDAWPYDGATNELLRMLLQRKLHAKPTTSHHGAPGVDSPAASLNRKRAR